LRYHGSATRATSLRQPTNLTADLARNGQPFDTKKLDLGLKRL
jgi:hypothetical protein